MGDYTRTSVLEAGRVDKVEVGGSGDDCPGERERRGRIEERPSRGPEGGRKRSTPVGKRLKWNKERFWRKHRPDVAQLYITVGKGAANRSKQGYSIHQCDQSPWFPQYSLSAPDKPNDLLLTLGSNTSTQVAVDAETVG